MYDGYMFRNFKKDKGFTLVELLVVIAIISILASLLLANFVGLRQRARDAQRKSDLEQIRSALELYRADNGSYPTTSGGWAVSTQGDTWIPGLSPQYIKKVPTDPINTGTNAQTAGNYIYQYISDNQCGLTPGNEYALATRFENGSDSAGGNAYTYGTCSISAGTFPGYYSLANP